MRLNPPISIERRSVNRRDLPPKTVIVIQVAGRRFHLEHEGYRPKLVLQDPEYTAATVLKRWGGKARLLLLVLSIIGVAGVVTDTSYAWPALGVFLLLLAITTFGKLAIATLEPATVTVTAEPLTVKTVEIETHQSAERNETERE